MMDRITVKGQGGTFAACIARPKTSPAPAVVVLQEGLPYQTLIASLLHKYAAGRPKRSEEWLFQGGLA